ncbi:hypothetical protein SS50377_26908 [Spironucleus salmonicida]|uniref:Uncharacterized protein n=1 Tax=Spironucleus salmonicida TaxID=348837 RepID=V6M2F0_9EUKA|nr:hypothetical protein SS50377_26908 [Spironucleus salmonicida]|eukprot:EST47419.1 Hypothetical protein SS50377_12404 [Spironucleus salmonicida]
MLSQLSPASQLFAKLAVYGTAPADFTAFKTAQQPLPKLPEPQFLKHQSLEEQRINWLGSQAKEQVNLCKQNMEDRTRQIAALERQKEYKMDSLSTIELENYLQDQQFEFDRIMHMSRFQEGDHAIFAIVKEFCEKRVQIEEFPVKNEILSLYSSDTLQKLKNSELIELMKEDIQKELLIVKELQSQRSIYCYLDKFSGAYSNIAKKVQQSNFKFQKTEKVNEKKKTEIEVIEEWVEDRSEYKSIEDIVENLDELILFIEFMQFLQLKQLKQEQNIEVKSQEKVLEEANQNQSEIQKDEIIEDMPQKNVTRYLGIISQLKKDFQVNEMAEQLAVQIYSFNDNFREVIPDFCEQYLIINNIPCDIKVLEDLDQFLIGLQNERALKNTELEINLNITAFDKIIVNSFGSLNQLLQANLAKVYLVDHIQVGFNYDQYSYDQIKNIHSEAKLITDLDEIIKAQLNGQAILHQFNFNFLGHWNLFQNFLSDLYLKYSSKNVGVSWQFQQFNRLIVENPVFEDIICDLYDLDEKRNIIFHWEIKNIIQLGEKLMESYCHLNNINNNMKKIQFEKDKEAELATMDPKKRPPPKKAEKLVCTPVEFIDSLKFFVNNQELLDLVKEFKMSKINLDNEIHIFEQMFLTIQIIMNAQQANDISSLQSDVDSQFSSLFQKVVVEYNTMLTYFTSVHKDQRGEDVIISDQLLTLNQITSTSLESFQKLYSDIATNFKQKSENILQINKKLPQGVILNCNQIIQLYLGYEVPEEQEISADKKVKPPSKQPIFNFRDIKIENFNQLITLYCASLIKQMTVVAKQQFNLKVKCHQIMVLFLSNQMNLKTFYPYQIEKSKLIPAKQQKSFDAQLVQMDADVFIKTVESAIPVDGITVDKYLLLIQSSFEKMPKTFTSQVFCEESNEIVTLKLQQNLSQMLSDYTDKVSGVFLNMTEKIKGILINYSQNVVEVIQSSLGKQEDLFASYVQVIGQLSQSVQKSIEANDYIKQIELKDTFEIVLKKEYPIINEQQAQE